jgi:hypothetical protein
MTPLDKFLQQYLPAPLAKVALPCIYAVLLFAIFYYVGIDGPNGAKMYLDVPLGK